MNTKKITVFLSLAIFACTVLTAQDFKYIGAAKCKMCHNKPDKGEQYNVWAAGPHAKAMESLSAEEAKDPKCLKCHSTVGHIDASLVASIKVEEGVSCESCHGPGSQAIEHAAEKKTCDFKTLMAIDEFPVLFVAAACAEGETVLTGAEELRVKESDRIAAMAEGLTTMGIINEVLEDGIVIEGGTLGGGVIHTHHDHRIAMSFAIAALRAEREISILDCDHVATSFPGFDAMARGLGLQISTLAD